MKTFIFVKEFMVLADKGEQLLELDENRLWVGDPRGHEELLYLNLKK